ncbi:MAG: 6-hydroxymethylpterin diphosphokinase MptE-like protein [Telluria sp.]
MSKFDIKDRIDETLYGLYNFVSEIAFRLNRPANKTVSQNARFRDIHAGQRCFIIGTGPSLNQLSGEEIARLKSEVVFGVNSLYKSAIGAELNPQYYTLMDNLYWEQWSSTFEEVSDQYRERQPVFITDVRAKHLVERLVGAHPAVYIYSKKYPTRKMSADIDKNIYAAMNVISYSILSAMHMGFQEIYLLGCDYSAFCTAGKGHCYDDESEVAQSDYNLAFYLRFYWITTEFHYLIAKLAKEKKIKVVNATPGSLLDAYPRTALQKIL